MTKYGKRSILAALSICLAVLLPLAAAGGTAEYTLGPGDRIVVTVFGHEDLSGEFELDG